jgi:CRP/FNR family cyclic AMP-dependent transcriptional regulator
MENKIDIARISRLLGVVDIVSVGPGDFLFKKGNQGTGFYIVRSGRLQIVSGDIVYETITTGDIVGEMAVVDEATRSASVVARTRADLIAVDPPGFLALVRNEPQFALIIMQVMARRLRKMNQRYQRTRARRPVAYKLRVRRTPVTETS